MKPIQFSLDNDLCTCELDSAVKPADLYGKTARVVQGPDGTPLLKGILTQEGRILPSNAVGNVKVDMKGTVIEALQYQREGVVLPMQPSSFKAPRPLTATTRDILPTFAVDSVFPIIPAPELKPGLYATTFNYRDSVEPSDALLMVRTGAPSFLLVGEQKECAAVGKAQLYNIFDADDTTEDAEEEEGGFGFDNL